MAPLLGFVRVSRLVTASIRLDQLVEIHEVSMIDHLVVLSVGIEASELVAL